MLNRLTKAGVLVENALFATLDPTVRKHSTPDGREYTISDTVGFVRDLPHQLVEAFRSTLEEIAGAEIGRAHEWMFGTLDGNGPLGSLLGKTEIHSGLYEITVKKVDVKNKGKK